MLYKVTPMMPTVEKKAKPQVEAQLVTAEGEAQPKQARKRRKSSVFDGEGHEVLITMMCLKCRCMKPLTMFGLRKMADGAIRNQPWCRTCRSGASAKKKPEAAEVAEAAAPTPSSPREPVAQEAAPLHEPAPAQ